MCFSKYTVCIVPCESLVDDGVRRGSRLKCALYCNLGESRMSESGLTPDSATDGSAGDKKILILHYKRGFLFKKA